MKAQLKDALPGERWANDIGDIGIVIRFGHYNQLAILYSQGNTSIWPVSSLRDCWRKTHNADGTPYEEPKPLPEFGECWAARDEDGEVCVFSDKPKRNSSGWAEEYDMPYSSCRFGKIQFRPELPWDKTACKVRVRLEVVE